MASSSVPVVKAALLDALQNAAGLATLNAADAISWGHPADKLQLEHVWIGGARFDGDEQPRLGRRTSPVRDEAYTLPVVVSVIQRGNDPEATERRWWEIVAAVEDAVDVDQTLGGVPGLHWARINGKEPNEYIKDGARGHDGVVLVACHARIS